MRRLLLLVFSSPLVGCATLHHAQLDEIDATHGRLEPFEIHVSDIGVNVREVGHLATAVSGKSGASRASSMLAMFQYGPKTGEPTFNDDYADEVAAEILQRCPSGRVTGLMSLRETTKYYAVSGEYVTVRGFCIVD